ncbi:MAG: pSer/pThr/pTyr-binding forkhead associated (FHA) protein [Pseudohongiellaceae bacterium]|jgi:pSer/pThr/pTyr-binding forkhead associated (FHA) protein
MTRPTLTVIVEHQIASRMAVSGAVTLGRLENNSLVLSDNSVSGHHGRIEQGSEGWRYTDMGSSNGSLIAAGPRLSIGEHFLMTEVTQILLGSTVIEFDPKHDPKHDHDHDHKHDHKHDHDHDHDHDHEGSARQEHPSETAKSAGGTSVSFDGPVSADVRRRGAASSSDEVAPPKASTETDGLRSGATTGAALQLRSAKSSPLASAGQIGVAAGQTSLPHGSSAGQPVADHAHQQPPIRQVKPAQLVDLTPATAPPSVPASSSVPPTRPVIDEPAPAPERAAAQPRVLVVLNGKVTTVKLPREVNVLGRSHRCDVVIDHASISSRHAEISHSNGRWMVADLGSTNGTRLGLARLQEPHELPNPGHFIMGVADLLFVCDVTDEQDSSTLGEQLEDEQFVSWLRRRGKVTRAEAKAALGAAHSSGCSVSEVLVAQGVLSPGALTELHHNAALNPRAESKTATYLWAAAIVLALAAGLFALTR